MSDPLEQIIARLGLSPSEAAHKYATLAKTATSRALRTYYLNLQNRALAIGKRSNGKKKAQTAFHTRKSAQSQARRGNVPSGRYKAKGFRQSFTRQ